MRVMATGGTGFIGSHTVKALLNAGHQVNLLVRDIKKAEKVYGNMNDNSGITLIKGDMLDEPSVRVCMENCKAVFHSAALVTLEASKAAMMLRDNIRGTAIVLNEACRKNIDSIVYVSTIAALFQSGKGSLTSDSPLSESKKAYARSKIDAEKIARKLQKEGFPVSITYPVTVLGPDDPGMSEGNDGLSVMMRTGVPKTSSGFQFVDVRDLARLHVRLLEAGHCPGNYLVGGIYKTWGELGELLEQVTGRRLFRPYIPGPALRLMGSMLDLVRMVKPISLPLSYEAACYATQWRVVDDRDTLGQFCITPRNPENTLRDTIQWLYKNNHL